jgi:hypothetical protein
MPQLFLIFNKGRHYLELYIVWLIHISIHPTVPGLLEMKARKEKVGR